MTILQCMGGWCRRRDICQHYHAMPQWNRAPAERLCGATDDPEPVKLPTIPINKDSHAPT